MLRAAIDSWLCRSTVHRYLNVWRRLPVFFERWVFLLGFFPPAVCVCVCVCVAPLFLRGSVFRCFLESRVSLVLESDATFLHDQT